MRTSRWEEALAAQIEVLELPAPEREYVFARPRKWRFDFAWPAIDLACEVEGITWFGGRERLGRHQTARGINADCEKYAEALLRGWRVLRVTQLMIESGYAARALVRLHHGEDQLSPEERKTAPFLEALEKP